MTDPHLWLLLTGLTCLFLGLLLLIDSVLSRLDRPRQPPPPEAQMRQRTRTTLYRPVGAGEERRHDAAKD